MRSIASAIWVGKDGRSPGLEPRAVAIVVFPILNKHCHFSWFACGLQLPRVTGYWNREVADEQCNGVGGARISRQWPEPLAELAGNPVAGSTAGGRHPLGTAGAGGPGAGDPRRD